MGFKANSIAKFFTYHECYVFYTRSQKPGESAEEFIIITALYKLAETCDFECMTESTIKDEMIRDRIVMGVADSELSKRLQLTPKLTVAKAIELVRTYEDVLQQQQVQRTTLYPTQKIDQV